MTCVNLPVTLASVNCPQQPVHSPRWGRVDRLLWTFQIRLAMFLAVGLPLAGLAVFLAGGSVGEVSLLVALGWWVAWSGTPKGTAPTKV